MRLVPTLLSIPAAASVLFIAPLYAAAENRPKTAWKVGRCEADFGIAAIPEGDVLLGEDGPGVLGRPIHVPAFDIDRHEVTNRQFAAFVEDTGYITDAENDGGGAVFVQPESITSMDIVQWWRLIPGADWKHPTGPGSSLAGAMDKPVVQVTFADAAAYAAWAGRALPTREQWERAARGKQTWPQSPMSWAYESSSHKPTANTWQGVFPVQNTKADGFDGLAPAGCFPPNDFGVYDMIGNVWEWTQESASGRRIIRGGSYLCSSNFCANFRPAGHQAQEQDLPTSHIGFRTVSAE